MAVAAQHFGYTSRDFLRSLVAPRRKDKAALLARLDKRRAYYLRRAHAIQNPGRRLNRIYEKMATIYASTCFAIKFGILPWAPEHVVEALLACTRDHVALIA